MNTRKLLVSGLMLICALLSACASATTTVQATPTTKTVPPTATSVPPIATIKPTPAQTTVSPTIFKIPISVTFGSDWRYGGSSPDTIELRYGPTNLFIDFLVTDLVDDHVTLLESGDPPRRIQFPDDFAGYLQSNNYWSEVTSTSPVTMGDANGYQIDAIGKSSELAKTGFLGFENSAFKELIGPNPQKFRFLLFDNVLGSQLLIVVGIDDLAPHSVAEFDALLPKVQEVLDTVVFSKP